MPDKVVSNTSPIISLLKIDQLDLLRDLYEVIYIPYAVYNEIEAGKRKIYYDDLSKKKWINIIDVRNQNLVNELDYLDRGEAEAIVLSSEINADLLIIDEKPGRLQARENGLTITGTLGILIRAKDENLIGNIYPILLAMKKKGVWIDENLIQEVLIRVNEM